MPAAPLILPDGGAAARPGRVDASHYPAAVPTTRHAAAVAATTLILALATGCGDDTPPPAPPAAAPTTPATAAPVTPPGVDSPAQQACATIATALAGDGARDTTLMRQAGQTAQQSSHQDIASSGALLTRAAGRAEAAKGAADEAAMLTGMVTAVTGLSTACIRAGLPG